MREATQTIDTLAYPKLSDGSFLTVSSLLKNAVRDRYALIIPEAWEFFARENLRSILSAYPCTGILVERKHPAVLYHGTRPEHVESIVKDGFKLKENPMLSFGDDVVYFYPTLSHFCLGGFSGAVISATVTQYMQAIYKDDTFIEFWDEAIALPKDIISIEHYLDVDKDGICLTKYPDRRRD